MARFATGSNVRVLIATILGSLVTVASPAVRADVPASSGAPASSTSTTHEAAPASPPHEHEATTTTTPTEHRRHRGERLHAASLSMGYPNGGRLQNGARLEEDETLRYMPERALHYGTDELIGLLRRSARTLFRRHHTRLTVGDLSAARGGPVGHHASHQSGRDADVAFFVHDRRGEPVALTDYVSFGRDGTPLAGGPLRFDTERNWDLVQTLLDDPFVHVEHIFVSNPLRSLLLEYARTHGASSSMITHAENVMHQPVHASPHANHFHVRISCPREDMACMEGVRIVARRGHRGRLIGRAHESRRHSRHQDSASAHEPHEPAPPAESAAHETPALTTDSSADENAAE